MFRRGTPTPFLNNMIGQKQLKLIIKCLHNLHSEGWDFLFVWIFEALIDFGFVLCLLEFKFPKSGTWSTPRRRKRNWVCKLFRWSPEWCLETFFYSPAQPLRFLAVKLLRTYSMITTYIRMRVSAKRSHMGNLLVVHSRFWISVVDLTFFFFITQCDLVLSFQDEKKDDRESFFQSSSQQKREENEN